MPALIGSAPSLSSLIHNNMKDVKLKQSFIIPSNTQHRPSLSAITDYDGIPTDKENDEGNYDDN